MDGHPLNLLSNNKNLIATEYCSAEYQSILYNIIWFMCACVWPAQISILNSFLNSCLNPVALYCVSGVFRQHFHRYLCCTQTQRGHHRLGMSMATNVCDTSFMSTIRRNNQCNNNIGMTNGATASPTQSITLHEKSWVLKQKREKLGPSNLCN